MIPVAVLGAAGRMGRTVCEAVLRTDDLALVAAVDPRAAGRPLADLVPGALGVIVAPDLEGLVSAGVEVAVDFTEPRSAAANLFELWSLGIHGVCGTTGLTSAELERLEAAFSDPGSPNLVLAPNFSISAVVLLRLAELAAPYFETIEIVELHHDEKRDAPSGTALETARRIEAAREAASAGPLGEDPTAEVVVAGSRGGALPSGIHLHSIRLRGLVAHEEVLFGTTGQSLTLRQDTYDRSSFMPGVLLAIRSVGETPGFTLGLERLVFA